MLPRSCFPHEDDFFLYNQRLAGGSLSAPVSPSSWLSLHSPNPSSSFCWSWWGEVKNRGHTNWFSYKHLHVSDQILRRYWLYWLSRFSRVRLFAIPCSPPGSSVHGILWARILEWVAFSFSRASSWPRDQTLHLSRLLHWQAGNGHWQGSHVWGGVNPGDAFWEGGISIAISILDALTKSKSWWNPLFLMLAKLSIHFSEGIVAESQARICSFTLKTGFKGS